MIKISEMASAGTITGNELVPLVQNGTNVKATLKSLNGSFIYVPSPTVSAAANGAALTGRYYGPGRLSTQDGNKRGLWFTNVTSAPTSTGNSSSINTAFNGDLSNSIFQIESRISGAATLGQPTTGYLYTTEAYPVYHYLENTSGWNQGTADNAGRTAAIAHQVQVYQGGQGDAMAFSGRVFVTGTRSGSTSFLANPAGSIIAGDMFAGAAGVYLNSQEFYLHDSGFDVAALGPVLNFDRTNATGAKGAWWAGVRVQSLGSQPIDVGYSLFGPANFGLDVSFATITNNAAITMKANQRIYGNVSATDPTSLSRFPAGLGTGEWIEYNSGVSAWNFVAGNQSALQVSGSQVVANAAAFLHTGTTFGVFNTTPTGQLTTWGTPTNNAIVANFPGSAATLAQCGSVISELIIYFKLLGFLGA